MFEPCRVYDPQGKLKKTYTTLELSEQYWRGFRMDGNKFAMNKNDAKHRKPNQNMRKLKCVVCEHIFETNHVRQLSCSQACSIKRRLKINREQVRRYRIRIKEAKAREKKKT